MGKPTTSGIKESLESGLASENKKALLNLHKRVFHLVKNFVLSANGHTEDAEDMFQEGLFILLKMARQNKLPTDLNPEAYLFTICKNLWKKTLSKTKNVHATEAFPNLSADQDPEDILMKKERTETLKRILSILGSNCQQILVLYYYEKKSMKAIAKLMKYSNDAVAKNKKSKCLKKIRAIIFSSKSKTDLT